MIGRTELLFECCGLSISLFFLAIGIAFWREPQQRGWLMAVLGGVLLFGFSVLFGTAFYHRWQLRTLAPEAVVEIQIGECLIIDLNVMRQIVIALHDLQAFSPNHEADPQIPMRIKVASGEQYYLHIKYRQAAPIEGIVLQFRSGPTAAHFNQGYAFSAELLPILRVLGSCAMVATESPK